MKLLLFDVDLTLISTGGAGLRALDLACQQVLSIEGGMDGISPSGKTDPLIVREILTKFRLPFSDDLVASILSSYISFLREEVESSTSYRVLPGIRELLDELGPRSDVLLGLATGNVLEGARIKLDRGKLNDYFLFGGFGSDAEDRVDVVRKGVEAGTTLSKNGIRPDDVYVIGDTPRDVAAGQASGYRTVAVATGSFSVQELQKTGANLVITDFSTGRKQFLSLTGARCVE